MRAGNRQVAVCDVGSKDRPRYIAYVTDIAAHVGWGGCLHEVCPERAMTTGDAKKNAIADHKSLCEPAPEGRKE